MGAIIVADQRQPFEDQEMDIPMRTKHITEDVLILRDLFQELQRQIQTQQLHKEDQPGRIILALVQVVDVLGEVLLRYLHQPELEDENCVQKNMDREPVLLLRPDHPEHIIEQRLDVFYQRRQNFLPILRHMLRRMVRLYRFQ